EREAKSLARLTHPNIVKVTDYGDYEGMPFLVMTYLPGGTLKSKLGKPIPWQEAARTLLPIARALDFAHRQNMIHRDVKPSNVLVTADGEPMLTDFGIAKILDIEATADLTGTGMGIGTPEYMAPEQWTGQATPQSDQYSLGVVFYEALTGRKPYTADTPAAILLKQANDPLPRPSQFARDIPGKVEKLIIKSLAKNPDDRYPSMGAFANALEGLVISEQSSVISKRGEAKPKPAPKPEETRTIAAPEAEEKTVRETPPVPFEGEKKRGLSILRYWPVVGGVVLVVVCAAALGNLPWKEWFTPAPTATPAITATPTLPTEITDEKGVTMRLVPAGTFKMGSEDGNAEERPVHDVYLDSYYMDVYEATNELYGACLNSGACEPNNGLHSYTRPSYFGNPEFHDYPVIYVKWSDAKAFCEWRGARLPTEAEWEKAARGTDGRTHPWGEGLECNKSNFGGCSGDTVSVESLPDGMSPYGLYNMTGNVWEWVADWYSETFYLDSPLDNPRGPTAGTYHVLRGGSWLDLGGDLRASLRRDPGLASSSNNIGFRCARSADSSALAMAAQPVTATLPPPAATIAPTQASLPEEIVDSQGVTMRLVPAGIFSMGSEAGQLDEKPIHDVYLDAYYMDIYEVTNKLYRICVDAGICELPENTQYSDDSNYADHPVVFVDWEMAKNYCEWRGGRLPTEAQWEKAARGTDGRTYPWGEKIDSTRANYNQDVGYATTPVGSFLSGVSPYGIYDMAGNVWEWVADWYSSAYYSAMPSPNPFGPETGQYRVLRGGAWYFDDDFVRSAFRFRDDPSNSSYDVGFRCARPAP
ncbi:MAG: SUMF1/EgtB/PvdO family nonheme iron enzyme, partial [Chloroflexota bacterium]